MLFVHLFVSFSSSFWCQGFAVTCDCFFVCVEVLRPCQPNGVISSMVSLPNKTVTEQA